MKRIVPFVSGLLFGLGLCLAGMTDPHKVLAFLDLAGNWDPSLALVMGGAWAVAFVAFRCAGRGPFAPAPATPKTIDGRLLGGAAIFGLGWGLVGLCPGPALADLGLLDGRALLFALAMASGVRAADFALAEARTARLTAEDG
ncbi:hypothetical protein SAMN06265338_11145 [Rhodoblastus acidophilus]|uniref:YeeE/YedE family protein n=1 Tax=Rhodoblastus acidophilus TaxID=1074 RepID=A0A212S383_RHOAC|nr:DUF6691 family protein [Rhodoblastus acidophilus]PPQ37598.1 hypothetical protein CKO16_13495 [Rhodoblastus acidophilus]RAI16287.1 hypothetical protein CH337_22165 [Rhodoblastus acidophilus]SNB79498.1 hypothetical protein SAMN06265338_11145 [Rhodoblastus acidophilus]